MPARTEYNITWVKGLSDSDLALCHTLTTCRLYRYNPKAYPIEKSIKSERADVRGVIKIDVILRTRDDKRFTLTYYLQEDEATSYIEKLEQVFDDRQ